MVSLRQLLLSSLLLAAPAVLSCGPEVPTDGWDSSEPCESDEECVERSGGEFDHCGMVDGFYGAALCCRQGSPKCPCLEDLSCEGDLVCYQHDTVLSFGEPGPYCQLPGLDWMLEPVGQE